MRLNDRRRPIRMREPQPRRVVGKVHPPAAGMTEALAFTSSERRRALFSPCGQYRYLLEIVDNVLLHNRAAKTLAAEQARPEKQLLGIIGLNPSTATELVDDPTIRREKAFAKSWGYLGIRKLNLAAFRATKPAEMLDAPDPIGPENTIDFLVKHLLEGTDGVVLGAWGVYGAHPKLAAQLAAVYERLSDHLIAFGLTQNGQPMHPLYQPVDSQVHPFRGLRR